MAKRIESSSPDVVLPIARDPNLLVDVRVVEHLRRRGVLDRKSYDVHLDALADEAEECEEAHTRFSTPFADRIPARR